MCTFPLAASSNCGHVFCFPRVSAYGNFDCTYLSVFMVLVFVVFLDVFYRSFSCIEQFNSAYKRQEKTRLDHISQRHLDMHYTHVHIRAWMNTAWLRWTTKTISETPPKDYRLMVDLRGYETRVPIHRFQCVLCIPAFVVRLPIRIEIAMNCCEVVATSRDFQRQRCTLRDRNLNTSLLIVETAWTINCGSFGSWVKKWKTTAG